MIFACKLLPQHIDRIALFRAANGKTETLASVKARTQADIIINGGTYNMTTGKPESYVTIGGKNLADGYCGWGYGISGNALDWSFHNALGMRDFIGAYGLLVAEGRKNINLTENTGARPRTAIGVTASDEIVIRCQTEGIGYGTLAEAMLAQGCHTAINLDGGGSTQWHAPSGKFDSGRAVSWWIGIFLTESGKSLFGGKTSGTGDDYAVKTNTGLVEHCKRALEEQWGYVWGTYGKVLTPDYLAAKAEQYSDVAAQYDWIKAHWLNRVCADCVGLIKSYYWWDAKKDAPVYAGSTDKSAVGMYNAATQKGAIGTMPDVPGLCVYIDGQHIGVYIGNGEVIEARGTKYGVVKTKLAERGWTHWLACPYISYPALYEEGYYVNAKTFTNGSARSVVYQDTLKATRATTEAVGVGTLGAGSKCDCLGVINGFAAVIYTVTATGAKKIGFIETARGTIV